jgi:hypothetical protein
VRVKTCTGATLVFITEDFALEIANIRNATNIPRSHRISNSKIGNMLEVELTHMERAPSAALTKIEDIYFRMTQTEPLEFINRINALIVK